jgi:hypothetical protein
MFLVQVEAYATVRSLVQVCVWGLCVYVCVCVCVSLSVIWCKPTPRASWLTL